MEVAVLVARHTVEQALTAVKYLGLILDSKMTFFEQIKEVTKSANDEFWGLYIYLKISFYGSNAVHSALRRGGIG